jgi:hypothetical protein
LKKLKFAFRKENSILEMGIGKNEPGILGVNLATLVVPFGGL